MSGSVANELSAISYDILTSPKVKLMLAVRTTAYETITK